MQERLKTISKHFYDDEVLFKDPTTGDLHLKEGVTRLKYRPVLDPFLGTMLEESYINPEELELRRRETLAIKLGLDEYTTED